MSWLVIFQSYVKLFYECHYPEHYHWGIYGLSLVGVFFGKMAFGCVLFAVSFVFLLGICYFPLGKMIYEGRKTRGVEQNET